jgi:glycosyltransferase involved in cell wall biosynthesis
VDSQWNKTDAAAGAMKIVHVITGLSVGGAQMMLYKLLSQVERRPFSTEVISLSDGGLLNEKIEALGVPVRVLGMRPGVPDPLRIYKLACWLRQKSPQLIQTWMYHADFIGGLAAKLAGGMPVLWNLRHSNPDAKDYKPGTYLTIRACASLSHWIPAGIVCCSEASRQVHATLGYAADRMVVIPNGFDLTAFKPDRAARLSVRRELHLSDETLIIGLVGRFHPVKDHRNFVNAAALLHAERPDVHFVLCGENITPGNTELAGWITASGAGHRFHLLGEREDMARINAALDIATCSSYAEGFPNVIGEAMACGVPCAVTDVGDSTLIVGDTGRIVPAKNPRALATAWRELIHMGPEKRSLLGAAARRRIDQCYGLRAITAQYERLYEKLATSVSQPNLFIPPCR